MKSCNNVDEEVKLMMNFHPFTVIKRDDGIHDNGEIPEWLLVQILIRLPAKFVHQYKLVSKEWFSLISDTYFVRAYISRATSQQQPWTFVRELMHQEVVSQSRSDYLLRIDELYDQLPPSTLRALPLPCITQDAEKRRYAILGLSNGLVLYGRLHNRWSLYVCNPVTGQWIDLPPHPTSPYYFFSWGFHTDVDKDIGSLKRYRVVGLQSMICSLRFDVFYSETGEWKTFSFPTKQGNFATLRREATAVNGVMHWISYQSYRDAAAGHQNPMPVGVFITVYDPYQSPEQVLYIPCPDATIENTCRSSCNEYKGKLRYFNVVRTFPYDNTNFGFKVWLLNNDKHHSGGGGWSLQHNISSTDIQFDGNLPQEFPYKLASMEVLSFHPFDLEVVYLEWNHDGIVTYNFETKELKIEQKCSDQRTRHTPKRRRWWPAFLLVIPLWPIFIPRPSLGAALTRKLRPNA